VSVISLRGYSRARLRLYLDVAKLVEACIRCHVLWVATWLRLGIELKRAGKLAGVKQFLESFANSGY
jgi:hypothetical protein